MQTLTMILAVGAAIWLLVYLVATDGSAMAATIMACAAMFAVLMLKIREREGLATRQDPVRKSNITPRDRAPTGFETAASECLASFTPVQPPAYARPYTMPSGKNPLMNILPPNDGYYGNTPPAAPAFNRKVEAQINGAVIQDIAGMGLLGGCEKETDATRSRLYQDLGGEMDLADSMRVFNANPATTMPNDQTGFAEFCYSDVGSCARGGELFCLPVPLADPLPSAPKGSVSKKAAGEASSGSPAPDSAAHSTHTSVPGRPNANRHGGPLAIARQGAAAGS